MLERRAAAPLHGGSRRAEPHRRYGKRDKEHTDELEQRPPARRADQPIERRRSQRHLLAEALVVFVPDDQAGLRRRQQWGYEIRHAPLTPGAVAEVALVRPEDDAATPRVAQSQGDGTPVPRRKQRVPRRRHQQPAFVHLRLLLGGDHRLEHVGDRREPEPRPRGEDANGVVEKRARGMARAPPGAARDTSATRRSDYRAARVGEARHLRELGREQRNDGTQHEQHRGAPRRGAGEFEQRRAAPLDRETEPSEHLVQGLAPARPAEECRGPVVHVGRRRTVPQPRDGRDRHRPREEQHPPQLSATRHAEAPRRPPPRMPDTRPRRTAPRRRDAGTAGRRGRRAMPAPPCRGALRPRTRRASSLDGT